MQSKTSRLMYDASETLHPLKFSEKIKNNNEKVSLCTNSAKSQGIEYTAMNVDGVGRFSNGQLIAMLPRF